MICVSIFVTTTLFVIQYLHLYTPLYCTELQVAWQFSSTSTLYIQYWLYLIFDNIDFMASFRCFASIVRRIVFSWLLCLDVWDFFFVEWSIGDIDIGINHLHRRSLKLRWKSCTCRVKNMVDRRLHLRPRGKAYIVAADCARNSFFTKRSHECTCWSSAHITMLFP